MNGELSMSTQILNLPIRSANLDGSLAWTSEEMISSTPRSTRLDWEILLSRMSASASTLLSQLHATTSSGTKRGMDIFLSSLALVALSPLFLIVAIAIKLTAPGPVFFWQDRVGLRGRTFSFPKFRSMVVNAEALKQDLLTHNQHGESVTFKIKDDPRITRVGRFIRRFSIDELPQFWCVLKGDMSLVGPRPAVASEVARYSDADRVRLEVKPGITCTWQVCGRSDIPFEQQVKLDAEYIRQQSLWLDLRLLFQTVPAVLTGKGAY
jgi:exopolysaccharide biosynthesis polyprenyl glycosylphosphotransferase